MVNFIPVVIKKLYTKWNIQGFVLFSLSLQTILILLAPFRKRTGNAIVILLIWLAYLAADWAASFAVGLISYSQKDTQKPDDHADILAFWAPFLLLHLGGPDTITAFALEDNTLWLRHFIGLLNQVVTTTIVFGQSLPTNRLWVSIVLLFVAGTIKYGERTCALFLANLNRFRESMFKEPDPGPYYEKLIEECYSKKEDKELNPKSKTGPFAVDQDLLSHLNEVGYAYFFFKIFNGLIVDVIFSFHECDASRLFFHQSDPIVSFKVLAIELNLFYEVLYTKVVVVHSMFGYLIRFISWCAVVGAFSTFYLLDKHGFGKIDVRITYTLFFGAIAMDTIALFMLLFSDWTAASIQKLSSDNSCIQALKRCFGPLLKYFLTLKMINWGEEIKSMSYLGWARRILFRRWYESLDTYNLINYCLKECPKMNPSPSDCFGRILIYVSEKLWLKDFYDRMKYVSHIPLEKELWVFIFNELKRKSDLADNLDIAKKICSARGDWVLQNTDGSIESSQFLHYIVDVDYDQSLILWHIATELCYQQTNPYEDNTNRKFCKTLSDYMLYLLVMQPTMMYAVAGIGQKRFHDTCTEVKNFYRMVNQREEDEKKLRVSSRKDPRQGRPEKEHKLACAMILELNTDVEHVAINPSKSVLFHACTLAKELIKLECHKRWDLMSKVWVELLSYAASHCKANIHAAQLSKGGELMTFVWLLMAHLGIGDQFQLYSGHAIRAKLIVGK